MMAGRRRRRIGVRNDECGRHRNEVWDEGKEKGFYNMKGIFYISKKIYYMIVGFYLELMSNSLD